MKTNPVTRSGRRWFLTLAAATCLLAFGCRAKHDAGDAVRAVNGTNAQRLANIYQQHQRDHGGRGPKDEKAFRAYIAAINPFLLERIDVDPNSLDSLFVSERDGQPFVIRYGRRGNDRGAPQAIVFEKEGVDGKRIVAFTGLVMEEVESAEYKKLIDG